MCRLSIIVPVYNVERYLNRCIDSILSQSFQDFELILVNDGSIDESGRICDKYAQIDKRIRVIHKENGGVSQARNVAISVAIGKYIAFVDSDDYISPNMYENLVSTAINTNADIVKCGFIVFDNYGSSKESKTFNSNMTFDNCEDGAYLLTQLYFDSILYKVPWNAIYASNLVKGVRFPEGLINEDNYNAGVYLYKANRIVCLKEALYFYRFNPNGLSKNAYKKRPLDIAIVTAKLHEDLIGMGLQDKAFLMKLENKFAREIFHCVKYSKKGVFFLHGMSKSLYDFVLSRLDLRRSIVLRFYREFLKRFDVI